MIPHCKVYGKLWSIDLQSCVSPLFPLMHRLSSKCFAFIIKKRNWSKLIICIAQNIEYGHSWSPSNPHILLYILNIPGNDNTSRILPLVAIFQHKLVTSRRTYGFGFPLKTVCRNCGENCSKQEKQGKQGIITMRSWWPTSSLLDPPYSVPLTGD